MKVLRIWQYNSSPDQCVMMPSLSYIIMRHTYEKKIIGEFVENSPIIFFACPISSRFYEVSVSLHCVGESIFYSLLCEEFLTCLYVDMSRNGCCYATSQKVIDGIILHIRLHIVDRSAAFRCDMVDDCLIEAQVITARL